CSPPLDRPRYSLPKYPPPAANRPTIYRARCHQPFIPQPLHCRTSRCIASSFQALLFDASKRHPIHSGCTRISTTGGAGIRIRTFEACSGFTLLRPIGSLSSPRFAPSARTAKASVGTHRSRFKWGERPEIANLAKRTATAIIQVYSWIIYKSTENLHSRGKIGSEAL